MRCRYGEPTGRRSLVTRDFDQGPRPVSRPATRAMARAGEEYRGIQKRPPGTRS
jgi:hypothetical protein